MKNSTLTQLNRVPEMFLLHIGGFGKVQNLADYWLGYNSLSQLDIMSKSVIAG